MSGGGWTQVALSWWKSSWWGDGDASGEERDWVKIRGMLSGGSFPYPSLPVSFIFFLCFFPSLWNYREYFTLLEIHQPQVLGHCTLRQPGGIDEFNMDEKTNKWMDESVSGEMTLNWEEKMEYKAMKGAARANLKIIYCIHWLSLWRHWDIYFFLNSEFSILQ